MGATHPQDDSTYLHDETMVDDSSISNYRMRDYEAALNRHKARVPKGNSSNNHSVLTNFNPLTALETSDNLSNTHIFEPDHQHSQRHHQNRIPN